MFMHIYDEHQVHLKQCHGIVKSELIAMHPEALTYLLFSILGAYGLGGFIKHEVMCIPTWHVLCVYLV